MKVKLLGTAAGGGFPQWNCWCPTCRVARTNPERARPRTQSSIAVSADGARWFLFDASPDVRAQLEALLPPRVDGVRHVLIEGIVLTDAELDHTLGIALLREARELTVWATSSVLRTLERDSRILPVTRAFACVNAVELTPGEAVELRGRDGHASGLTVEAFPVAGDPPRFASADVPGHTVGVTVRDGATGGTLAFVPGCGALDEALFARLAEANAVLIDGTFWSDDELVRLGIGTRGASEMGHLAISGAEGSLAELARLRCRHRVYVHINNTNPILLEDSIERRAVERMGVVVGADGMELEL
jgi:pyrroloquinoline quinone biosynthesis protein B